MASKAGRPGIASNIAEIPAGAQAIGMVKKGSAIFELPPFARYIVFHQEEPPQIITYTGEMLPLNLKPIAKAQ